MDAAELLLLIAGSSAGATAAIGEVNAGLTEMEARGGKASAAMNVLKTAVAGIAVVGAAVAGVSAVSVKMAADFQTQMELVRTQAHDTTDNIQQLGDQVKQLATATGIGPDELARGLYHVTSVGYTGAAAMQILTQAAKEAQIAGANLDDTTYSLTSVMNTFGYGADKAHDTMAQLNAIVGAGDMRFQDLNGAISTGFLAAGDTFGVSLQSMGAALAYLTDRGASAEESATRLKMSVTLLGAPTKQAAGILGDLGLGASEVKQRTSAMDQALQASGVTTTQLSDDMRKPDGIMVALQDLATHMEKGGLTADETAATLSRAFGGGRSGAAIMSMIQHLDVLQNKYEAIGKGAGDFDSDWQITLGNFNIQWQRVQASLDVLAITWGQKLLPVATAFMRLLADDLVPSFQNVESAIGRVSKAWSILTGDLSKGFTGGKAVWDVGRLLGLDPTTAGKLADQLGPTLDRLWEGARNVSTAFQTLFFGIQQGMNPVDVLTGFFFQLGLNYDTAERLSRDLVNAWDSLVATARELWPEIENIVGQVMSLAGWLANNLFPVLQWTLDNGDLVKAALIAVGIGFAAIKVAEVTSNILQFTSALREAYAVAGASGTIGSLLGIKGGAAGVLGITGEGGGLLGALQGGAGAAKNFLLGTPGTAAAAVPASAWGRGATAAEQAAAAGSAGTPGAIRQTVTWVSNAGQAIADAASVAGAWTLSATKATAGWVATQARAVATFVATKVQAGIEAGEAGLAWLGAQAKIVAGWIATQARAVATYVATVAEANPNSNAAAIMWIAGQIKIAAGWVTTKVQAAASFVATTVSAGAEAVATGAKWLAAQAAAAAGWVTTKVQAAASFVATTASAGAEAATTRLAWLGSQAQVVAGWVAARASTIASFVAVAAAAVAQSARTVASWLLAQGAMLAVRAATFLWMAAQWLLNAALTANPISLVIVAIAALIAIVIWAYQNVGWFHNFVNLLFGLLKELGSWLVTEGSAALRTLGATFQWLSNVIQGFITNALGLWSRLKDGFVSLAGGISDAITRPIKDGLNAAIRVVNGFLDAIYGIPVIGGAISGALHSFHLPQFARGGVTSGPSIVGEGGAPEYVIPTDRQFGARARDLWVQAGQAIGALKLGAAGVGEIGGQCVEWVEAVSGHFFPVQMASEMAQYVNAPTAGPGLIGVSTIPPYGHTFIVTALNQVIDSNWVAPLRVGMHALSDIPDIVGYINLGNPLGTLAAAGISAGKSVGSFLGALIGGPIGSAEAAAKGLGGIAGAIAFGTVDTFGNALKTASFDDGGFLSPGLTLAWNGTGKPEPVGKTNQGGDIHVHVTNPAPQPYQIAQELSWALKTMR